MPKIPSYRITDVARAINSKCLHEVVGIRPGEKLHEEMITKNDAMNTIEFPNYYVIVPAGQVCQYASMPGMPVWQCAIINNSTII